MRDDSLLTEYALGLLDWQRCRELEQELAVSSELQAELRMIQITLGKAAAAARPRPPGAQLRGRILAALDDATRFDGFAERLQHFLDLPPPQIEQLLEVAASAPDSRWCESGVPGILLYPFRAGENVISASAQLIFMAPGVTFPRHRHRGDEWGFVLQGYLVEDSGRRHGSGDIVYKATATEHSFAAEDGSAALIVTLLEGKIEWLRD